MFVTRNVRVKYMAPAGDDGADAGGGGAPAGGDAGGQGDDASKSAGDAAGDKPADSGVKKPSDEEARLLKENMAKKEQLRKAQDELANLKKQFEGIDPEAVKKMLAEQRSAEEKQLEAKGDYERLKQRMAEEHGKEVSSLKAQLEAMQSQVAKANGTISDLTVGTQFGQSQFIAGELTLTPAKARVIYGDYFDVEDGKVVGYDKPRGAANRTALVDQYGSAVPFDLALQKIVEADPEKDHLLKSKIKSGAGSESKKPVSGIQKNDAPTDGVSKIAAGLKGFKFPA